MQPVRWSSFNAGRAMFRFMPICSPLSQERTRFFHTRCNVQQIRLSVTLEDLTVYVAQHGDKERESVIRQLSAPVDSVKGKLGEMEETLAGFQRTMHLVLSEVDADRERSAAIAVRNHSPYALVDK